MKRFQRLYSCTKLSMLKASGRIQINLKMTGTWSYSVHQESFFLSHGDIDYAGYQGDGKSKSRAEYAIR